MSYRRTASFALVCLTALFAGGCDRSQDAESPVSLGTYSIDHDASTEATLPVWQAELARRADKEIADLVASPPSMIKEMRENQVRTERQDLKRVPLKVSQLGMELTLSKGKKFALSTEIPELSEQNCSGLWTIDAGDLVLVRDTVDGETMEKQSSLRFAMGDGTLTLRWPGLPYVFVLRQG
jgi:hypothetical protein